jgi:hypothetical protein
MVVRLIALGVVALGLGLGAARAQGAGTPAEGEIHAVIERQLQAFREGDGATAFSFASPAIQRIFGDPDTFMHMVRTQYEPVYRARSSEFLRLLEQDGALAQEVFLVGPAGETAMALYVMEQQPDGTWRINGVYLVDAPDEMT